ncbi:DUF3592 domain-containing protein [Actinomadura sp. 7K507]|uniref:DUF3592 domain-containing protein n=1 Tax=Actinomadura sp. 7K507 TaxID=2530365 RepID=UPI0014048452|nr:DUF3592 domain-containing protein [Actinomadura sp. 7K507]
MNPDHVPYVLFPGFMLFGLLFVAIGVRVIRTGRHLRRFGHRAPGVVVRTATRGQVSYPTVRFRMPDGTERETQSDLGTNLPTFRKGQAVTVLYDPDDPDRARLDGPTGSGTLHGAIFIAFGLCFAGVGAIGTAAIVFVTLG